jgi:L-ribulose-5-phosphate 3-epimerase
MRIATHDIAVCSWSLKADDTAQMIQQVRELGLSHVHLGLGPMTFLDDKQTHQELSLLQASGLTFTAGMMSFPGESYATIASIRQTGGYLPDETWEIRRQMTLQGAGLAKQLGITLLTTHIGFVPKSSHEKYPVVLERIREIAKPLAEMGIDLLAETGQETPSELLQFLNDLGTPNVHVNFDPANVILYGVGDPIDAIRTLGRHIRHVHVKDAKVSDQPGIKWGREVPFGEGDVNPTRFLQALAGVGYEGPLAIECEIPGKDLGPVRTAIQSLEKAR